MFSAPTLSVVKENQTIGPSFIKKSLTHLLESKNKNVLKYKRGYARYVPVMQADVLARTTCRHGLYMCTYLGLF